MSAKYRLIPQAQQPLELMGINVPHTHHRKLGFEPVLNSKYLSSSSLGTSPLWLGTGSPSRQETQKCNI